jgi:hypothetical protein
VQGEPDEAEEGPGEVEITKASTDLVQQQLWELAQQVVHDIEVCNNEQEILEKEFNSVRNGILIMES